MPPKKTAAASATKKAAAGHASYRDMIKDAIVNLKERNGSSRQSIKKYVQNNNDLNNASPAVFDNQFNKAIKAGVEKGDFTQPKGPSGPVKLAKKDAAEKPAPKKAAPAKAAPAKAAPTKAVAPKKAAAKKTEKAEKAEKTEKAPKKATKATTTKSTAKKATTATKKKTTAKPKANTAKPRKTPAAAPAIIEKPKIISTTKSGRVTKTTAQPESAPKRAAPKKKA
ncbi:hypothetical protein SI65_06268 [Aspergillus cristatus]|uniref:Histone H1 n=1 Tax=Aspergillus cristatus TaxID=573508 RepID=A0A1E3BBR1_ASPCR|nr:hypothetical protein SI65_06268 [Aspergillus cristatus]